MTHVVCFLMGGACGIVLMCFLMMARENDNDEMS